MSRRIIPVDRALLETAVRQAEANGALAHQQALCQRVAQIYNLLPGIPEPITLPVTILRIKQFNIATITKAGRKGRIGGIPAEMRGGKRIPKREKFAQSQEVQNTLKALRFELRNLKDDKGNHIGLRFLPLVDRMEQGSRTAAMKIHCLGCAGWSTTEVRECQVTNCALKPFRAYHEHPDSPEPQVKEASSANE